jgi:3-oxoacyl-[acyl-carrier protein] reductase
MSEPRTVLVTGASRGIGHAIAHAFARAGYRVIGTATGSTGVAAIESALAPWGANHQACLLDVADRGSLTALFEHLTAAQAAPAILVNNAGITRDNLLLRMKDDEWQQVLDTNLTAVFHLCRHFIRPMLKARFGRIINLTSVVGASGNPG